MDYSEFYEYMCEFMAYEDPNKEKKIPVRLATQEDIDKF